MAIVGSDQALDLLELAEGLGDETDPFLSDLDPADGATGVLVTANILLTINDTFPGVDLVSVIIQIDTGSGYETVYDGDSGGFQTGYSGTVTPNGLAYDFEIDPDDDLPFDASITVRVLADDYDANGIDETYDFSTESSCSDAITATASAIDSTHVVITFDAAMVNNPALTYAPSYEIVRNIDGRPLIVDSAAVTASDEITLSTEEHVNLADYDLTIHRIESDEIGFCDDDLDATASAVSSTVVAVTFNADVIDNPALYNPLAYAIDPPLEVLLVQRISATVVHLTTLEHRQGDTYSVTIHRIERA